MKRKKTWLNDFQKRTLGGFIRSRLSSFTNQFILSNTTEKELEDLRKQIIERRQKAESDYKHRHPGKPVPYWVIGNYTYTLLREFRKVMRYRHAQSFQKDKLYFARSNVYGDIKNPGWGIRGYCGIPKKCVLMFVGRTEVGDCLFMKVGQTGRTDGLNEYIRITGVGLDRVSEVENE